MGEVHRLPLPQAAFSLQTAGRLMTEIFPPWVQDLACSLKGLKPSGRPARRLTGSRGQPFGCPIPENSATTARLFAPRR